MDFSKINRYHYSMLPYLLQKLQERTEGDATLLDKTTVMWGSPMGDPNVHNHVRVPFLFAGGGDGKAEGNVHLKAPDGTPLANVMLSMLHKLGLDDMESFGDSTGEFALTMPRSIAAATSNRNG